MWTGLAESLGRTPANAFPPGRSLGMPNVAHCNGDPLNCFRETFWLPLCLTAPEEPLAKPMSSALFSSFPPCVQAGGFCTFFIFLPYFLLALATVPASPSRCAPENMTSPFARSPLSLAPTLLEERTESMGIVVRLRSDRSRPLPKGALHSHRRLYTRFHPADEVSRNI